MQRSMYRSLLLNITNKNSNYGRQDLATLSRDAMEDLAKTTAH
ncbi:MAG: hypothetical protein ACI936_003742 [Paraglaciecola sp.]|jgi:hypothetical protein